ncbi:glycoside hydrolase family 2 TIM barrel-domain containing protein [Demequina capsici]|uniref:Beta-galactosidase n=1 Tax=Demequina capsici TaxID=3075620 RepID=A0AA96F791_9MICO|nr:glycoside hydrolase family 2 TIM barrel-domain containing protein [Demequina sp. OYTSA14]WNM24443.1 glycoside hydrolase family 2 TIM barrel-domain containing protein [Demequina sp. OYTSA14]
MSFKIDRITDPEYVSENRMAARSDHRWFRDAEEALTGDSGYEQCLNGLWKLHHAKNPSMTLPGFEQPGMNVDGWDDIPVPAHVQMHGYDRPQYANVQYPWDGLEDLEPGQTPQDWNPVASYVKEFTLERPLAAGERLSVRFHGAESGIAVWLNGAYVGWATDSFTPSEFDLTEHVVDGVNRLAAQVFKWTAASWLEDQDFYRFHGIFRDVVLHRRPAAHVEDVELSATVARDLAVGEIALTATLEGPGSVRATVVGVGPMAQEDGRLVVRLDSPRLWSAEDPYLYEVLIEVLDADGAVTEVIPQRMGLRRVDIEDAILKINGKRVVFHGTNRHEFGARGRAMTAQEIERDVQLMKRAGVDSVRTSHYPNSSVFYELCDRYGLYVIDEMNLETHAMWDKVVAGELTVEQALPGDRQEWKPALLDRANSMYRRDRNHPSIVMWSLGNESFGGSVLRDMTEWFHATDPTRPVHYEGVHWDPRYPDTTDVTSQMYTPAAEIEAHLKEHRDKPFVLCEYAHSMGNSFGAVDKYLDLADREPLFQGGFIWDFVDQTLPLVDRYGVGFKGYGGDSGETPHDAEFSANGIVFSDRTPTPAYQEVRYLYQPFRTAIGASEVRIENRRLFTDLGDVDVVVALGREGRTLREVMLEVDVPAGEARTYPLPFEVPSAPGEYTVDVSYRLKARTEWADAGYELGWEQAVVNVAVPADAPAPRRAPAPRVVESTHNVGVHGSHFSVTFSRLYGYLVSYRYGRTSDGGRELLRDVPYPSFWHAPTSNERGWGMPFRDGQWEVASQARRPRAGFEKPKVVRHEHTVEVQFGYELPTVPPSEVDVTYVVDGDGHVDVTTTLRPGEGLPDMPELAFTLTVDADLHRYRWYGDGPAECYVDRRGGSRLGVWDGDVREQLTPYMRPQESGSRTGVRWAEVLDDAGFGIRLDAADPVELSALPWTPFEIQNARHPNELPPIHRTILRPALKRRGVGGDNSWGAMTHPEHRVPTGELNFTFGFQGVLR